MVAALIACYPKVRISITSPSVLEQLLFTYEAEKIPTGSNVSATYRQAAVAFVNYRNILVYQNQQI